MHENFDPEKGRDMSTYKRIEIAGGKQNNGDEGFAVCAEGLE